MVWRILAIGVLAFLLIVVISPIFNPGWDEHVPIRYETVGRTVTFTPPYINGYRSLNVRSIARPTSPTHTPAVTATVTVCEATTSQLRQAASEQRHARQSGGLNLPGHPVGTFIVDDKVVGSYQVAGPFLVPAAGACTTGTLTFPLPTTTSSHPSNLEFHGTTTTGIRSEILRWRIPQG
jgi:hypothetical protein